MQKIPPYKNCAEVRFMKTLFGRKGGLLQNLYLASKCANLIRLLNAAKIISVLFTFFIIIMNVKRSFSE